MNNKVCVDLIVPAISEKYNIFLPVNKKVIEVIYLLNKAINEMTDDVFPLSNNLSLINAEDGTVYNNDFTVFDNKILNGSRLILI